MKVEIKQTACYGDWVKTDFGLFLDRTLHKNLHKISGLRYNSNQEG
jgi:hypothetical protein